MWKSFRVSDVVRRSLLNLAVTGAALGLSCGAGAAVVNYDVNNLGGNQWRYQYTLQGTAPAAGFEGLTIYFTPGDYSVITNSSAPAGWDVLLAEPDTVLASDGFFDVLNLSGPLTGAVGPTQFIVDVQFAGSGTPGSQRFELYIQSPFEVVQSGLTQSLTVPEPASGTLVGLALILGLAAPGVLRRKLVTRHFATGGSTTVATAVVTARAARARS